MIYDNLRVLYKLFINTLWGYRNLKREWIYVISYKLMYEYESVVIVEINV